MSPYFSEASFKVCVADNLPKLRKLANAVSHWRTAVVHDRRGGSVASATPQTVLLLRQCRSARQRASQNSATIGHACCSTSVGHLARDAVAALDPD